MSTVVPSVGRISFGALLAATVACGNLCAAGDGPTFRVRGNPLAKVPLSISDDDLREPGGKGPKIGVVCETKSGPDGRFVFEHVPPGRNRIGRDLPIPMFDVAQEMVSASCIPITVPAGRAVHFDLGAPSPHGCRQIESACGIQWRRQMAFHGRHRFCRPLGGPSGRRLV